MKNLTKGQKAVLLGTLCFLLVGGIAVGSKAHSHNEYPGMIRLHIIANSNSQEDQQLKLKVRNELLKHMEGQESVEATRAYIRSHIPEIEETAEKVIRENGYSYPARAELKVSFIPEKSYEDLTLPAGNYEALKVRLGRAEGKNWWCVIFPQLCLIEEKPEGEKLVLKSKIKEMLKDKPCFSEKQREKKS